MQDVSNVFVHHGMTLAVRKAIRKKRYQRGADDCEKAESNPKQKQWTYGFPDPAFASRGYLR
jgi:hypothetical protein